MQPVGATERVSKSSQNKGALRSGTPGYQGKSDILSDKVFQHPDRNRIVSQPGVIKERQIPAQFVEDTVAILWSELFEQTKERDEVRLRIDAKPVAGGALRASHEPGKLDVAEGIAARGANGRTDALEQLISGDGISRRVDETGVVLAATMLFLHGLCLAANSRSILILLPRTGEFDGFGRFGPVPIKKREFLPKSILDSRIATLALVNECPLFIGLGGTLGHDSQRNCEQEPPS